jgi:elongation factor G
MPPSSCRFSRCLCGSALHGIGVQPVLDAVADYLPSPLDVPPVRASSLEKKGQNSAASPTPTSRFAAGLQGLPAKNRRSVLGPHLLRRTEANSRVLNPGKDKKENVAQLWRIHATKRESRSTKALAGDIVG